MIVSVENQVENVMSNNVIDLPDLPDHITREKSSKKLGKPKNTRKDTLLAKVRAYKLRRPKKKCLYCEQIMLQNNLLMHIRRKHPEIDVPPVVTRNTMLHHSFYIYYGT